MSLFKSNLVHVLFFAYCSNFSAAKPAWFPATLPKSNAVLELELPHPFELVLKTWENGPPDPQFIREEVVETRNGHDVEKSKTIFTKNPFPFLIQKTVVRDKELIFIEVQRLNMKLKIAQYWSVNKCMESVGRAYRTSTIRAHPSKPGYTLIEQSGGVEVTSFVPGALRGPIEKFACGAFIDVCKQALAKLNVTLSELASKQALRSGTSTEDVLEEEAATRKERSYSGTLQGLGLVLSGLCCKLFLGGSKKSSIKSSKEEKAVLDRLVVEPSVPKAVQPSRPFFTRSTPPFRAAAAAFAVALFSTQLL